MRKHQGVSALPLLAPPKLAHTRITKSPCSMTKKTLNWDTPLRSFLAVRRAACRLLIASQPCGSVQTLVITVVPLALGEIDSQLVVLQPPHHSVSWMPAHKLGKGKGTCTKHVKHQADVTSIKMWLLRSIGYTCRP